MIRSWWMHELFPYMNRLIVSLKQHCFQILLVSHGLSKGCSTWICSGFSSRSKPWQILICPLFSFWLNKQCVTYRWIIQMCFDNNIYCYAEIIAHALCCSLVFTLFHPYQTTNFDWASLCLFDVRYPRNNTFFE